MYIDLSLQKIGALLLIALLMGGSLFVLSATKEHRYGSTPPFASIGLAFTELTLNIRYTIEGTIWRASQVGSAAFAFMQSRDSTASSTPRARAIPVLTYHRIVANANDQSNVTEKNFIDQMFTLKRAGWQTITLKEYQEFMEGSRDLPEKSFLVTFDDGAKQSFYPVDPLFKILGYEGVMYIIVKAAETPESAYYLSSTEIKRMLATGRWEIGSHSFDGHHPYPVDSKNTEGIFFADKLWLPREGRIETAQEFTTRVRDDLLHARSALEKEYEVTVDTFAFPFGNETGIAGAANFLEGTDITEHEASTLYSLGFLQTNNRHYSFNYPQDFSFLAYRIHVDHDWDGRRFLQEMENGLPKQAPFEDDFSEDRGWLTAWGSLDLGKHNFLLKAQKDASSASAFLDGSRLWDSYSFDAALNWKSGSIFLLADLLDSKTYDSCAFSEGQVQIQSTVKGVTKVLAKHQDSHITSGENVHAGIRVHGNVIECLWEYKSLVETYERTHGGGIGIQVWNPELGSAAVQVSEILVRPFEGSPH